MLCTFHIYSRDAPLTLDCTVCVPDAMRPLSWMRSNCNHCRVYPSNVFPLRALIKASPRNGYYLTILSASRADAKSIQGIYGAGWDASRSETIIQETDWTLRYWILAHVLIRCFYLNLLFCNRERKARIHRLQRNIPIHQLLVPVGDAELPVICVEGPTKLYFDVTMRKLIDY